MSEDNQAVVVDLIKERACTKRDVYDNLIKQFKDLRKVVKKYAEELTETISALDKRLEIKFEDKGDFQFNLTIAGDIVIFYMHSNVFQFSQNHHIWNSSYVQEDSNNAFTGNILIYNFLADSFRLKRLDDIGYLIARVFVNKDDHFLVDGQRQMGYLYNDFVHAQLDKATWRRILESALMYTLDFNLYVPPYQAVNTASVHDVMSLGSRHPLKTGKRFGFQFGAEGETPGDKV